MAAKLILLALLLQQPNAPFTGSWFSKVNDRGAILLTVTNSSGMVSGQVRFFVQTEQQGTRPVLLPLLDPIIAGDKLSFTLAQPEARTDDIKSATIFEFVQTSRTTGKLIGYRASEHVEIALTKVNWVERHF